MAVEKEIEKTESAPQPNAVFDDSSNFLIYATLLGIKVSFFALNWVAIISLPSVIYFFNTVNFFFVAC
jgi:peptidylprolyl isomerase domain and WD repeat-containing protein 1